VQGGQVRRCGARTTTKEPPAEDWPADTLYGVFGVHVLWRTPDNWGGQDAKAALGSGGV
jgi:hypothetical protein